MAGLAATTGWLAILALSAAGLGLPIARRVPGLEFEPSAFWTVTFASGAAALIAIAGICGVAGALRPLVLLPILAVAALPGAIAAWRGFPRRVPRLPGPLLPIAILCAVAVVTLLAVATPSPFYDQYHYHLAFPERWLASGRIEVFEHHAYSYLASNMGLLYAYALAGPGILAAQATHWAAGALTLLGAFSVARKIGANGAGAYWSMAWIAATPSFNLSLTWCSSDLGLAAFGTASALLALGAGTADSGRDSRVVLSGLFAGVALGCKYTAATAVCLPVIVILLAAGKLDARIAFWRLSTWGASAAATMAPWAARNWWLTGNPIHPFVASWFAGGTTATGSAAGIAGEASASTSWESILTLRTFAPLGAAGWIGPQWLILLPLTAVMLIVMRRPRPAIAVFLGALAGIIAWTRFNPLGRYLMPVLVLAAPVAGMAWEQLRKSELRAPRLAISTLVALALGWSLYGSVNPEIETRVSATLGRTDPSEFINRYVTYWSALPVIHARTPRDARLLLVGEPRAFGIEREVVIEDPFRTPWLVELSTQSADAPAIADRLRLAGVTHLLYNAAEATRIASMRGRASYFSEADPPSAARLQQFFDRCLTEVGKAGPVQLLRVAESCH